jgi:hypothetical protein
LNSLKKARGWSLAANRAFPDFASTFCVRHQHLEKEIGSRAASRVDYLPSNGHFTILCSLLKDYIDTNDKVLGLGGKLFWFATDTDGHLQT